jgi:hypothetical protein
MNRPKKSLARGAVPHMPAGPFHICRATLLPDIFDIERVNHSDAYSFLGGIHINGAESYFARLRRMIRGQHHRVSPGYLAAYAAHAAWLEDHRRQSNGSLVDAMIGNALAAPVSRLWKGYWQRAA